MVRVKLQRYCNYGFQTVEDLQAVAQRVFPSCAVHAYRLLSPSCAVHAYRRLSPSRAAQSLVPVACVCLPCQLPVAKIICFIAFMSASFLIIRLTNRGKAWDIKLKGQNIPYIIRNTSLRIKMSRLTEFNKYFKIGYTFR